MANLRRKSGLGKDPERAATRAQQLAAIDPDWNCPWPLDWQRHYAVLRDLAADEPHSHLPHIAPGVQYEGDDLGRWLERHKKPGTWASLSTEQQERLTKLGIKPLQAPSPTPAARGQGAEQGTAGVPARPDSPHPVHRPRRQNCGGKGAR
ncbi:helicase associated domain-containing protein [Streptomyces sp. NPDC003753]